MEKINNYINGELLPPNSKKYIKKRNINCRWFYTRYLLIAFEKLGLNISNSSIWSIYKLDRNISRIFNYTNYMFMKYSLYNTIRIFFCIQMFMVTAVIRAPFKSRIFKSSSTTDYHDPIEDRVSFKTSMWK